MSSLLNRAEPGSCVLEIRGYVRHNRIVTLHLPAVGKRNGENVFAAVQNVITGPGESLQLPACNVDAEV